MILPFATPSPGEVVNLSQIVRFKRITDTCVEISFADGMKRTYSDKPAEIISAEIGFIIQIYRAFQLSIQAQGEQSLIVPADFIHGPIN